MSRRGMSILEMLCSVMLIGAVLLAGDQLFLGLMSETPRLRAAMEERRQLGAMLRQLRLDVEQSRALPPGGELTGDGGALTIDTPAGTITYARRDGRIVRTTSAPDAAGRREMSWAAPRGLVQWRPLGARAPGGLEVRSAVEQTSGGSTRQVLPMTEVFFAPPAAGREGT